VGDAITNSIVAVVAGLVSGTGVALLNHVLSRKKTQAEIQKVQAEAQKTRAETDKILAEIKNVSAAVSYSLADSTEVILFDGTERIDGFDVRGREGTFWTGFGAESKPASPKGQGELKFEDGGVLNVQRKNTEGRFELWFQRYIYKGKEHSMIPKDEVIAGKRKLRVSCEAKAVGGQHVLRFVIFEPSTKTRLAEERATVKSNEWTRFQVFLPADANQDCQFRIDDEEVSSAPSSVQIRNIVLAQRK